MTTTIVKVLRFYATLAVFGVAVVWGLQDYATHKYRASFAFALALSQAVQAFEME